MDEQKTNSSGVYGMNAPAMRATARKSSKKAPYMRKYAHNFDKIIYCDSLNDCLTIHSRFGGGGCSYVSYPVGTPGRIQSTLQARIQARRGAFGRGRWSWVIRESSAALRLRSLIDINKTVGSGCVNRIGRGK